MGTDAVPPHVPRGGREGPPSPRAALSPLQGSAAPRRQGAGESNAGSRKLHLPACLGPDAAQAHEAVPPSLGSHPAPPALSGRRGPQGESLIGCPERHSAAGPLKRAAPPRPLPAGRRAAEAAAESDRARPAPRGPGSSPAAGTMMKFRFRRGGHDPQRDRIKQELFAFNKVPRPPLPLPRACVCVCTRAGGVRVHPPPCCWGGVKRWWGRGLHTRREAMCVCACRGGGVCKGCSVRARAGGVPGHTYGGCACICMCGGCTVCVCKGGV